MLVWSIVFLAITITLGVFGFTERGGAYTNVARVLAAAFAILFAITLLLW
ncbi:hypothetical protein BH23BAC4_BH23BAC4_16660 [soil metagenome]